jgi:hypothetical protein
MEVRIERHLERSQEFIRRSVFGFLNKSRSFSADNAAPYLWNRLRWFKRPVGVTAS